MARNILALTAGIITAVLIIFLLEGVSASMFPMPKDLDPTNKEALAEHIAGLPLQAFILILSIYAVAAFLGALVATSISKTMRHAYIVGIVLIISNIANLAMIPHPLWFSIASLLIYLPFAWLGGRIGTRSKSQNVTN